MIAWHARFTAVALLLAGTAIFLQGRARGPFAPPRTPLASFPVVLQSWVGVDVPISAEDLKTLGAGEFLQRTYKTQTAAADSGVDLYLAYLSNQTVSYRHAPQDCLVGSGWSTVETGVSTLALPGDPPFLANRYLIARGEDRQLVWFWYSTHGRRVASESQMNFYLVLDSLRWNRRDNALVRLNTELRPGEKAEDAERRLLAFAGLVNPLLHNYIPR